MNITCPRCQKRFSIPEERIPPNKEVTVLCPSCRGRIPVSPSRLSKPHETAGVSSGALERAPVEASERSLALCCLRDSKLSSRVGEALDRLGYRVVIPKSPEEGVNHLRFSSCRMLIYEDGFDTEEGSGVWAHLRSLSGEERRGLFAVWIGNDLTTGDPMVALSKSADLVIAHKDVERLQDVLSKAIEERKRFYGPFRQMMRELGLDLVP